MSQFLFVRGTRAAEPHLSGFDLKTVKENTVNLLNELFGAAPDRALEWFEIGAAQDGDFAMYFDAHFQLIEGRDELGRSVTDLLTDLADHYDDIVLAYGAPDSEIERLSDLREFVSSVVSSYERVPVELHSALIRS